VLSNVSETRVVAVLFEELDNHVHPV
jgi:hypothetical protein